MPKKTKALKKAQDALIAKDFIDAGLNVDRYAKKAGITHQAASQRIRVNPDVRENINRYLEKAGITAAKVYKVLALQLDATKTGSFKPSDDEDEESSGNESPDWMARDKAVDKCLKLMDHYPKETEEPKTQINAQNLLIQYVDPNNPQKPLLRSPLRKSHTNPSV